MSMRLLQNYTHKLLLDSNTYVKRSYILQRREKHTDFLYLICYTAANAEGIAVLGGSGVPCSMYLLRVHLPNELFIRLWLLWAVT